MVKTATNEAKNGAESEGWEKSPGGGFPPLMILDVGHTFQGVLKSVDVQTEEIRKKVKGKVVADEKTKTYYRFVCTASSAVLNAKKAKWTIGAGEVVTLPGAGALDRSMELTAFKLEGLDISNKELLKEAMPKWNLLLGREFRITRQADGEMKHGSFKGNKVKIYDVEHRATESVK